MVSCLLWLATLTSCIVRQTPLLTILQVRTHGSSPKLRSVDRCINVPPIFSVLETFRSDNSMPIYALFHFRWLSTLSSHICLARFDPYNKNIFNFLFCTISIYNMLTLISSVILHRKTTINITFQLFPNSSIIVFVSVFTYGNIEIKL